MGEPKYKVGDVVKFNNRQGTIHQRFKQQSRPNIVWRYYILMRTGMWSVQEENIQKLVKRKK